VQGPRVQGKKNKKNSFPVTVKIRTSGYQTPECSNATLPTDLQILDCELHKKCVWRPGSAGTSWGSYSAPLDPLAEGDGRKERVGNREGAEGERNEGREGVGGIERGREGAEEGRDGSTWIFVHGPRVPSYATARTMD